MTSNNKTPQKKTYAEYMTEVFKSPWVEKFQKQRTRRLIVASMAVLWLTIAAMTLFLREYWGLTFVIFLLFFPLITMLNMSVRGVTEIPIHALDARLADLRARAFHDAYYIGIIAAFALGYSIIILTWDIGTSPYMGISAGTIFAIPAMRLAWNLPDETDEEA